MCSRSFSTHCRNSPSASFFPFMSHKPGYPCDAAAGSVVHKLVPRSFPQRGLRKQLPAFLLQAFCTLIGVGWNHGGTGFHRNVLRFGNVAVTKHSHFWSTIPRTVAMLLGYEGCYAFLDRTRK